ncbi:MAG: prepilin-type N-terminal cleavage/methylation domain-containing protein [Deltaproteobacteria bacterium]|nr:prepilin-type N-terminal cleavage/methylation domain-containing protein [Deltaproteobacteria bacterium]
MVLVRHKAGFTLIELLVVLVIISIVSGFVAPKLAGTLTNVNLRTASKRVAASLRYARSQAASHGMIYFVFFDIDRSTLMVGPNQATEEIKGKTEGAEDEMSKTRTELRHYNLPENVFVKRVILGGEEATSGFFSIGFFPDGGSSGGTVILGNKRGHSYFITADIITGTVRINSDEI